MPGTTAFLYRGIIERLHHFQEQNEKCQCQSVRPVANPFHVSCLPKELYCSMVRDMFSAVMRTRHNLYTSLIQVIIRKLSNSNYSLLFYAHSYIHASEARLFFPFEPYRIVIGDVCSILKADTLNANLAGCGIFIKEHIIIVICGYGCFLS